MVADWGGEVLISNLGEYYAREISTLLVLLIILPVLAFGAGWWCGDRFNVPSVSVEMQ